MMELLVTDGGGVRVVACEAVLFDMDGTLVDSNACVEKTWRRWAARHGLDADALLQDAHGRQSQETIRRVAPHLDTPEERAGLVRAEEDCREVVEVPGARALLASLAPGRWAVVTSAWRRLAEIRLECAGLPVPRVLVTADQVSRSKPHPDGYLLAAERLGFPPAGCVVVEDAPVGVESGRAAGMRVIGIATTYARERLRCELCIDDLRSIRARNIAGPKQFGA
jgi:sugar-phosphatase